MALGPTGNNCFLTDVDVRVWLRDNDPEANLLIDSEEFSTEEIRAAMTHTVDYFNETPPNVASYDYDKFPYRFALLRGTAANLLFMAAHRSYILISFFSAGEPAEQDVSTRASISRTAGIMCFFISGSLIPRRK